MHLGAVVIEQVKAREPQGKAHVGYPDPMLDMFCDSECTCEVLQTRPQVAIQYMLNAHMHHCERLTGSPSHITSDLSCLLGKSSPSCILRIHLNAADRCIPD